MSGEQLWYGSNLVSRVHVTLNCPAEPGMADKSPPIYVPRAPRNEDETRALGTTMAFTAVKVYACVKRTEVSFPIVTHSNSKKNVHTADQSQDTSL